jgi:predicted nucleic acid-binding Zn ribbon protein
MNCPNCGKNIDNDSQFCEYCGAKIEKSKRGLWITLAVIALFALVGCSVYMYNVHQESLRIERQRLEEENRRAAERQAELEAQLEEENRRAAERQAELEALLEAERIAKEDAEQARRVAEQKAKAERIVKEKAEQARRAAEQKAKEEAEQALKAKTKGSANGHEWVDLGLPSGTKWATTNVGANTPEVYGNYYAWCETTTKSTYDWSTYKGTYKTGSKIIQTKYCKSSTYGTVDNKTTLDLSDDAAYVNWGSSWRMPTKTEQEELINTSYTTWTWTTQNGVKGYKVTSKTNGNSIFLPAAGYRDNSDLYDAGSNGGYWSSSLYTDYSYFAYDLDFNSDSVFSNYRSRDCGRSVRPVLR